MPNALGMSFEQCVSRFGGVASIDDPEAFCGSLEKLIGFGKAMTLKRDAVAKICPPCAARMKLQGANTLKIGRDVPVELSKRIQKMTGTFHVKLPIVKAGGEGREGLVTGWAAIITKTDGTPIIDFDGDIVPVSELEKAAQAAFTRSSGEGMAGDMHDVQGVADVVESMVLTTDKRRALKLGEGPEGWVVTLKINDPVLLAEIESGEKTELSIRGRAKRTPVDGAEGDIAVLQDLDLSLVELLSVVDMGASGDFTNRPSIVLVKRRSDLTAISRDGLSKPFKRLERDGILEGRSVFDFGQGRGDDVRQLRDDGVDASGWDPNHAPDNSKKKADIVNLGYVVNVIEKPAERVSTIQEAFKLARDVLVVTARTEADKPANAGKPTGDGVVTSRDTFQRYFSNDDLLKLVAKATGKNSYLAESGVVYVFRDPALEAEFTKLASRNQRKGRKVKKNKTVLQRLRSMFGTSSAIMKDRALGMAIEALNAAAEWDLNDLAGASGVEAEALAGIIAGDVEPTAEQLEAVAAAFGMTGADLVPVEGVEAAEGEDEDADKAEDEDEDAEKQEDEDTEKEDGDEDAEKEEDEEAMKRHAALTKQNDDLKKRVALLESENELKECIAKAKTFDALPGASTEELAKVFQIMKSIPKAEREILETVLKSSQALIASGAAITEIGTKLGSNAGEGSAFSEFETKVSKARESDPKLEAPAARIAVAKANPELYKRMKEEAI